MAWELRNNPQTTQRPAAVPMATSTSEATLPSGLTTDICPDTAVVDKVCANEDCCGKYHGAWERLPASDKAILGKWEKATDGIILLRTSRARDGFRRLNYQKQSS